MNILSIGNSFSCDAQRYLHRIAKADGVNLETFNLFIGGCSLSRHYRNMLSDEKAYELEMNGESTGFTVSMKEALLNRDWDIITIQQVSNEAPYYETYQPYLDSIIDFVRNCVPKAKIAIHQTWAYEENSFRLNTELGYNHHSEMFRDIESSYKKAAKAVNADFIIPSGELFESLIENGIKKVHRDTFHAHLGIGRYALGLLWYGIITNNSVRNNTFCELDTDTSDDELTIVRNCVEELIKKQK